MPVLDNGVKTTSACPTVEVYNCVIAHANDMLLYRQFQQCHILCRKFALIAKNNSEDPNSVEAQEALMVVGIQALAELNRWSEVIPFVVEVYEAFEESSALIAKLCLQLHVKLGDRGMCNVIVNLWLRRYDNLRKKGYMEMFDVYIYDVLIPDGEWDTARGFLEVCPIEPAAKEARRKKIQASIRQQQLLNADKIEVLESSPSENATLSQQQQLQQQTTGVGWLPDMIQGCVTKLNDLLESSLPHTYIRILRNVGVACLAIYFLLTRWQSGFLPDSIVGRLMALLQRLWRGMFAPFYKSSR